MYNIYQNLPIDTVPILSRWVRFGVPLGSFFNAVVSNDLVGACGSADERNQLGLVAIVAVMHNCIPANCYHSKERVAAWMEHGGLRKMDCSDMDRSLLVQRHTPRYCLTCLRWVFVRGQRPNECYLCGDKNIDLDRNWSD